MNSREHSQSDETKPSTSTPGWIHYNINKLLECKSRGGFTNHLIIPTFNPSKCSIRDKLDVEEIEGFLSSD